MPPVGYRLTCWFIACLITFTPVDPGRLATVDAATGSSLNLRREFAEPPQEYWPRPLWFWNNTPVTADGIRHQMQLARNLSKYSGFGILPFGRDFAPAYLSEDYFKVYGAALEQAKALGLTLSLYDEYGFPSGSAGSQNSSDISLFAQRWLDLTIKRLDKHEWEIVGPSRFQTNLPPGQLQALVVMNTHTLERVELSDRVRDGALDWAAPAGVWKVMAFVCVTDGDPICDYLDPEAADRFIEITHQAYFNRFKEHFGTTIDSTFFDEPTMYRAQGRTWTARFNEQFVARHGFDPRPYYPAMWYDIGPETQAARNYLFGFRTELYAAGFTKRIQDWCDTHGITATGHQDQEEVINPVSVSGDLMKCFKHLAIPGIDKIGGDRPAERFYKVISSAAYNYDRHLVMSETYGAMGDLSWEEIYTVAMEQYTKGINLLIPHAVWYDVSQVTFKPELSWRHPGYAPRLPEFNTYLARLNLLLQNDAAHVADIAVLYPIATLQGSHHFDGPLGYYQGGVAVPEADYVEVGELLSTRIGRDFTYLHPEVMDAHCAVEGRELVLPNRVHPARFAVLVLPGHRTVHWSSLTKIKAFYDRGGCVIATGVLPSKSAEFGHDADVARTVDELFGTVTDRADLATAFTLRENDRGGRAIRMLTLDAEGLRAALDAARPDYDVTFEPGRALRYIHKRAAGRHLFYFANLNPELRESTVTLRGRHDLETWDPHTGEVSRAQATPVRRGDAEFTQVRLALPHLKSVFLISAKPNSFEAAPEAPSPAYVMVVAHRGDHTAAHENSLEAIEAAIRAGADYIELDVRATRDGDLVLMHDATVDRTTDGQGAIGDLSWTEVQSLRLADEQRPNLPPAKVPRLAEALGVLQGRAGLYLDFKSGNPEQVVILLRRYQMVASTIVYDDREAMRRWKQLEPALRTMTSPDPEDLAIDALASLKQRLQIEILDGPASVYTPTLVREIQRHGLPIWPDIQGPWEDPQFWEQIVLLQAAGYQTDRPADFIAFLRERGLRGLADLEQRPHPSRVCPTLSPGWPPSL